MKFTTPRPERKQRSRSIELVSKLETEPDSEFFDPRVDFPAKELTRLKKFAADRQARARELHYPEELVISWWLGLVDKEYDQLLHADPLFFEGLLKRYRVYCPWVAENPRKGGPSKAMFDAIPPVQLYPALRTALRTECFDAVVPSVLKQKVKKSPGNESFFQAISHLRGFLVLYPEFRKEGLNAFSIHPGEVVVQLQDVLKGKVLFIENKAKIIASVLLAFPELRPEILNILLDQKKWIQEFKKLPPPYSPEFHEFAFDLTVIGAESARIDERGQIQLELKPRPSKHSKPELPVRPTV